MRRSCVKWISSQLVNDMQIKDKGLFTSYILTVLVHFFGFKRSNVCNYFLSNFGLVRGSPNGTIVNFTNGTCTNCTIGRANGTLALPLVQMVLPMVSLVKH